MKKIFLIALMGFFALLNAVGQTTDHVHEIGLDGHFWANNLGGSGGIGVKYGYVVNENFVVGPSIRYQRSWYHNYGLKSGSNIFGGGVWAHVRLANYFFAGAEFEYIKAPYNQVTYAGAKSWVPTLFLGGGFSHAFNSGLRLNAGVYYDVINNLNSPFRPSYVARNVKGVYIPIIYRIGIFFPIG